MSNIEKQAELSTNIKLSFRQRLDYSISEFGYNSIYYWISAFMAVFLTDQMGIAAGAVSFLTLFVRIFDGINDPIIGSMADRSVDKGKGKYKPWVRWGALGCAGHVPFHHRPVRHAGLLELHLQDDLYVGHLPAGHHFLHLL